MLQLITQRIFCIFQALKAHHEDVSCNDTGINGIMYVHMHGINV